MSKRTRIWDVFPTAIEKTVVVVIVLILVGIVWVSS